MKLDQEWLQGAIETLKAETEALFAASSEGSAPEHISDLRHEVIELAGAILDHVSLSE